MAKPLVYVDTDIGLGTPGAEIDDAAALILLFTTDWLACIGAGSVFGNVPSRDALTNLCRLRSFFGRQDLPIGRGADLPLVEGMEWFTAWQEGYGPTRPFDVPGSLLTSTQLMIDLARAHPHQVTLLAIGPLTNLALAARLAPDFVPLVKQVVVMGGASAAGEEPQAPEFNLRCDPEAAQIVLSAGWEVTLVGLDITRQVTFSRQEFAALNGAHPATRLLREEAPTWIDRMEKMGWGVNGCGLHDAIAVSFLIDPSLFKLKSTRVRIELHDRARRGMIFCDETDPTLPRAWVASGVDAPACHDLVWSGIQDCER
jgi:inosine-uridine nucleoside N-ribohydrolase